MKTYELNGRLYKFDDDKVPEGAVLHSKAKAVPVKATEPKPEKVEEPKAEPEKKAKKAPANKSRKAGANK